MANEINIIKEGLTYFDKSVILSWKRYDQQKNTMSDDIKTTTPEAAPKQFPVYYSKSNFHRVINADGMYGGSTPTAGNIIMHIFSHMMPLPDQSFNDLAGNEIVEKRVVKPGVVREIEVSVIMNLPVARAMRDWLDNRIKYTEGFMQKPVVK